MSKFGKISNRGVGACVVSRRMWMFFSAAMRLPVWFFREKSMKFSCWLTRACPPPPPLPRTLNDCRVGASILRNANTLPFDDAAKWGEFPAPACDSIAAIEGSLRHHAASFLPAMRWGSCKLTQLFMLMVFMLMAFAAEAAVSGKLMVDNDRSQIYSGKISWNAANNNYVVHFGGAASRERQFPRHRVRLDIQRPPQLDTAMQHFTFGQNGSVIAMLTPLLQEYIMLQHDEEIASLLAGAYLKNNNFDEAEKVCKSVIANKEEAGYKGKLFPTYWRMLFAQGNADLLCKLLSKARLPDGTFTVEYWDTLKSIGESDSLQNSIRKAQTLKTAIPPQFADIASEVEFSDKLAELNKRHAKYDNDLQQLREINAKGNKSSEIKALTQKHIEFLEEGMKFFKLAQKLDIVEDMLNEIELLKKTINLQTPKEEKPKPDAAIKLPNDKFGYSLFYHIVDNSTVKVYGFYDDGTFICAYYGWTGSSYSYVNYDWIAEKFNRNSRNVTGMPTVTKGTYKIQGSEIDFTRTIDTRPGVQDRMSSIYTPKGEVFNPTSIRIGEDLYHFLGIVKNGKLTYSYQLKF